MKRRMRNRESVRVGLARALSKMGYCSRTVGQKLVAERQVSLNGRLCLDPETPVVLPQDQIEVAGKRIQEVTRVYLMMNKPRGIVTTASDEKGRDTVYSLLPANIPWVAPVGRLDKASEGLLLLTNDSEWAARITAPESHVEKTYHVQVRASAPDRFLSQISAGVSESGELLRVKVARVLRKGKKNCWIEIVLDEGKNRHIRRMFAALEIEVLRLVRVAIGDLELGNLWKGAVRELANAERESLASHLSAESGFSRGRSRAT